MLNVKGPSELSIVGATAFHAIYSNNSPCVKGPWYNIEQPAISLRMTRDQDDHTRRRKTWDRAFSVKGENLLGAPSATL